MTEQGLREALRDALTTVNEIEDERDQISSENVHLYTRIEDLRIALDKAEAHNERLEHERDYLQSLLNRQAEDKGWNQ
jgi:ribosomal protein S3AE